MKTLIQITHNVAKFWCTILKII